MNDLKFIKLNSCPYAFIFEDNLVFKLLEDFV